jgi:hypothetical protein
MILTRVLDESRGSLATTGPIPIETALVSAGRGAGRSLISSGWSETRQTATSQLTPQSRPWAHRPPVLSAAGRTRGDSSQPASGLASMPFIASRAVTPGRLQCDLYSSNRLVWPKVPGLKIDDILKTRSLATTRPMPIETALGTAPAA